MWKKKKKPIFSVETMETVIGKNTRLEGSLCAEEGMRIDGQVEGDLVVKGDLVIGEDGRVCAAVEARNVLVAGELNGSLKTEGKLEITACGSLVGDAFIGGLVIQEGGLFHGNCQMAGQNSTKVLSAGFVPRSEEYNAGVTGDNVKEDD